MDWFLYDNSLRHERVHRFNDYYLFQLIVKKTARRLFKEVCICIIYVKKNCLKCEFE